ncbi:MAG: NADP-dependent oxidoreductase [Candidatus Binatia bacterium]
MTDRNRRWILKSRPQGMVDRANFEWREEPKPEVRDGEFVVRNLWLSCDPAQRAWMEIDTYIPKIPVGAVMYALSAGEVVESKHPGFQKGDRVTGSWGWQDYAATDGSGLLAAMKIPPGVDFPTALSLFGVTGLTAYFGLLDVGAPKAGDTVVVSGAAGSTGSFAAQIAKIKGCRVIGIAGGEKKCAWLTQELGLDAAIDYRKGHVGAHLHELAPGGIDVFFDNVGGEILDAVLGNLAVGARIALCGAIASYNDIQHSASVGNTNLLIVKCATMRGFLVMEFASRFGEAIVELAGWAAAGKIKSEIDVVEGLENAPDALHRLFTGANLGKQLVKIGDAA